MTRTLRTGLLVSSLRCNPADLKMMLYDLLDIFFLIFHTSIILFNVVGWIWKSTRKWNLLVLVLTGLSWTVLGIWYGFGYCPCTDWHWDVLKELGKYPETPSYIEYLFERLTTFQVETKIANVATLITYIILLFLSAFLNYRQYKSSRKKIVI